MRRVAGWVVAMGLFLGAGVPAVRAQQPTVVIVVRHAERAPEPRADPVLSAAGEARARDLAAALSATRVGGVIVTQFQRTRLTAAPLADALGLTPVVVTAGRAVEEHARAIADTVRSRFAGQTVLVVGHSNTVGPIIAALGGPAIGTICDNAFANLYVLVLRGPGDVALIRARFGVEDAPPPPDCQPMQRPN